MHVYIIKGIFHFSRDSPHQLYRAYLYLIRSFNN